MSTSNHLNINIGAIQRNFAKMKANCPQAQAMAVVKANAYGLGAVPIARKLENQADGFCVALPEEARELIEGGIQKPILNLGYLPDEWINYFILHGVRPAVFSYDLAKKLSDTAQSLDQPAYIHIALDTGHSRIGFQWDDPQAIKKIKAIAQLPQIKIVGTFSHFSRADEEDYDFTKKQFARFVQMTDQMKDQGIPTGIRHIANDAAVLRSPEYGLDGFRCGICLYGTFPSPYLAEKYPGFLEDSFYWTSRVSFCKTIVKGTPVSYGATWHAPQKTRLATVQVGYADGYLRALSNKGLVRIHGQACPVVGRICMDQIMVDISSIDPAEDLEAGRPPQVKPGDPVLILGKDPNGGGDLPIDDLAEKAGTINYELMTGITSRVSRIYKDQ